MVRLPIVGERENLFLRCLADQTAVVVGGDYELFVGHVRFVRES